MGLRIEYRCAQFRVINFLKNNFSADPEDQPTLLKVKLEIIYYRTTLVASTVVVPPSVILIYSIDVTYLNIDSLLYRGS